MSFSKLRRHISDSQLLKRTYDVELQLGGAGGTQFGAYERSRVPKDNIGGLFEETEQPKKRAVVNRIRFYVKQVMDVVVAFCRDCLGPERVDAIVRTVSNWLHSNKGGWDEPRVSYGV